MGRGLSRPARWARAGKRADDVASELQYLRDEWITMRDEFVAKWTAKREEYLATLDELIRLQRYYEH